MKRNDPSGFSLLFKPASARFKVSEIILTASFWPIIFWPNFFSILSRSGVAAKSFFEPARFSIEIPVMILKALATSALFKIAGELFSSVFRAAASSSRSIAL